MATVDDLMTALCNNVAAALASLNSPSPAPPAVEIFKDEPPVGKLQNLGAGTQRPFVSIFQQNDSRNETRYMQHYNQPIVTTPSIAVATSSIKIAPFGTATVTLSNTPIVNDAVGITVFQSNNCVGQAAALGPTDSLTAATLALKVANAINADPTANAWLSASASGAVITLTNLLNLPVLLYANAANVAIQPTQRGNEVIPMYITVWSQTYQLRNQVGEMIRQWIFATQFNGFIELIDGSFVRIKLNTARMCKEFHLNDIYRWDFVIDCDMPIIFQDQLYAILYIDLATTISNA